MKNIKVHHNKKYHGKHLKVVNANEQYMVSLVLKMFENEKVKHLGIVYIHENIKKIASIRRSNFRKDGSISVSKLRKCGTHGNCCVFEFNIFAGTRKIPTLNIHEYNAEFRTEEEIKHIESIDGFNI